LAGLGARDSLRLEAGLCLYGSDLDENTTPVEAALEWAISKVRRRAGVRAGGFPGADVVLPQLDDGPPRRRVGQRAQGRMPVRGGTLLFAELSAADPVGKVTSGGFGPSVAAPVAMGYLPRALSAPGTRAFAEVRGSRVPVEVTDLPFIPHRYKRTIRSNRNMLRFTADHEWLRIDGDVAVVGITEHAQEQLGDLVFVELPASGKSFAKGAPAAVVESVKAASDVYAPISGQIVETNESIVADPTIVNSDPLGNGWFFKLKIADPSEIDSLMDEQSYKAQLESKV